MLAHQIEIGWERLKETGAPLSAKGQGPPYWELVNCTDMVGSGELGQA